MSKKRSACTPLLWPIEVYDYERKAITDAAVGGIDLRRGHWIHCKWCNSTLKTTPFSLASWRTHEKGQLHCTHKQEFDSSASQPHFNFESLKVVRRDLYQNKQQQARYERDVTKVINAMTSLVSDQQNDLDALQLQMRAMTREMEGLKRQVTFLRLSVKKTKIDCFTEMDIFEKRFRLT
eukprot:jgi/Phyca11/128799/e_gw1.78.93.1